VLIYHSGNHPAVVGTATVDGDPYPDPEANDPKLVVVDVCFGAAVPKPVTLAAIKAEPLFAEMVLVRQPRLSIAPVSEEQWQRIAELAGLTS
jgi:predicted RNA-binding protein with PUA-like domain